MTSDANLILPSHKDVRNLQPAIAFVLKTGPFNYGLGSRYEREEEQKDQVEPVIDPITPIKACRCWKICNLHSLPCYHIFPTVSKERDKRPKPRTLEEVSRHAVEVLLRDGSHTPILIIEGNRGGIVVAMQDMASTHEERLQQMAQAGFVTAQRNEVGKLRQLFFITEAWMSTTEGGELPEHPPSQDPKRKEILAVSQLQVQPDRSAMVVYEMHRDQEGMLVEIAQMQPGDSAEVEVKSPLLDAFTIGFELGATLRRR